MLARTPASVSRSIRTGNDYDVAVWVSYPAFPVIRSAFSILRVSVSREDDLDIHFLYSLHDCVEVFDLEPEQQAVSVGFVVPVADGSVIVFDFEAV